ncbi:GntR family transcriptional regulator [Maledivibacter halophilus]|uniref:Transcriptional regulator, GntR family n=1 Tax=Maledivibacter halophilus TaxID=36842 RepID=A0A1T5IBP4_9FIRM|nr:GntR family transcriptional regulator [Maledivibacter halophilus]SKC36569.1 transcriptional regulator, GntR family [Maledivibacter halophilus]
MSTQTDYAYEIIKNRILDGSYKPSENLVEMNIANELKVSRNTTKKALLRLESEGLVVMEPNKGARVKDFTLDEIVDFLMIREVLEGLIFSLVAKSISDEALEKLDEIIVKMEKCVEQSQFVQYSENNLKFHNIIYDLCKNEKAVEMTLLIKTQLRRYNLRTILIPGRSLKTLNEHKNIYKALKNHDSKEAEKAARTHISNLRNTIIDNYDFLI